MIAFYYYGKFCKIFDVLYPFKETFWYTDILVHNKMFCFGKMRLFYIYLLSILYMVAKIGNNF